MKGNFTVLQVQPLVADAVVFQASNWYSNAGNFVPVWESGHKIYKNPIIQKNFTELCRRCLHCWRSWTMLAQTSASLSIAMYLNAPAVPPPLHLFLFWKLNTNHLSRSWLMMVSTRVWSHQHGRSHWIWDTSHQNCTTWYLMRNLKGRTPRVFVKIG